MLIARTLGRTLAELDETMSIDEYKLWVTEYNRMPWGTLRDVAIEMQLAEMMAFMVNMNLKKHAKKVKPEDFLKIKQPQSVEDQSFEELSNFVGTVNG